MMSWLKSSLLCVAVAVAVTLINVDVSRSQGLSVDTMPFGCGNFKYVNVSWPGEGELPGRIEQAIQETEHYLEYLYQVSGTPSLSFGIVYGSELVYYKSFGVTDLTTDEVPTEDSIYRIGSVSKVFTVLLAYVLRDYGIISFDAPIAEYNTNFEVNNPWGVTQAERLGKTLTIKQLASQVSGLPRTSPCSWNEDDEDACIKSSTAEILARLAQQSTIHPTDVQASYSNLAYGLLGNILSEYVDETYETALQKYVLDVLHLSHTGDYLNPQQSQFAATGYNSSYDVQNWTDIGWEAPAGNLFSSVRDMATLISQYFSSMPGRYETDIQIPITTDFLFSPQTFREMLRPVYLSPDLQSGYGSPWEMQVLLNRFFLRGKGGNIYGFSSDFQMVPEMRLGVVALSNFELDGTMFTMSALEILIPPFQSWLNGQRSMYVPRLPADITPYVGSYYANDEAKGFTYTVIVSGDMLNGHQWLMISMPYQSFYASMMYFSENRFIMHQSEDYAVPCWDVTLLAADGTMLIFDVDADGDIYSLQMPDSDYSGLYIKGEDFVFGAKKHGEQGLRARFKDRISSKFSKPRF